MDIKSKEPLVSVVIPLYNAEKYIVETLQSVVNQSYKHIEVIIVDDCSSDNSVFEAEHYLNAGNIKYHIEKLNRNMGGPAGPRNIGISISKGDYIAFLDADDVWHNKKIETQINVINNYGIKFCSSLKQDFKNSFNSNLKLSSCPYVKKDTYLKNLFKNNIYLSSVVIDKKLLIKHKFCTKKSFVGVEDYLLWLKILKEENVYIINEYLLGYRVLESSLSRNKFTHAFKVLNVLKENTGILLAYLLFMFYILLGTYRSFIQNFRRVFNVRGKNI